MQSNLRHASPLIALGNHVGRTVHMTHIGNGIMHYLSHRVCLEIRRDWCVKHARGFHKHQTVVPQVRARQHQDETKKYQPALSSKEKSLKRAESQRLTLVTVNLGQKGLTDSFVEGLYAALEKNTLVKVRTGGYKKDEATKELCDILDCECVHSIGSVITLYRQKGLPVPSKLQKIRSTRANSDDDHDRQGLVQGSSRNEKAPSRNDTNSQENKQPPPEFTVMDT